MPSRTNCRPSHLRFFPLVEGEYAGGVSDGVQRDEPQGLAGKEGGVEEHRAGANHLLLRIRQRRPIAIFVHKTHTKTKISVYGESNNNNNNNESLLYTAILQ